VRSAEEELVSDYRDWNQSIIDEFRANGGRVSGPFEGAPLVLLHTTGRRSGVERVNPLMSLSVDGRLFVFASKAGAAVDPDWFTNLVAHSSVTVERGEDSFAAEANVLVGSERDRIYAIQCEQRPQFAEYQAGTKRIIPVVELVSTTQ
jgi:deazaflavin-dependent oxidoreductase (nitroreductase family)